MSRVIKEDLMMNTQEIINALTKDQIRTDLPELVVGNNVKVYQRIVEGSRTRTQMFEVQLSHTSYAYYSTISNNFTPCGGTVEMIVLSFSSAFLFSHTSVIFTFSFGIIPTNAKSVFAVISSSPILN